MAITVKLIPGPMGISGPRTAGVFGAEDYELTGDGVATTVTVTANWLRLIDFAHCTPSAKPVINNATRSVALTFAAAPLNGDKIYLSLYGQGR